MPDTYEQKIVKHGKQYVSHLTGKKEKMKGKMKKVDKKKTLAGMPFKEFDKKVTYNTDD